MMTSSTRWPMMASRVAPGETAAAGRHCRRRCRLLPTAASPLWASISLFAFIPQRLSAPQVLPVDPTHAYSASHHPARLVSRAVPSRHSCPSTAGRTLQAITQPAMVEQHTTLGLTQQATMRQAAARTIPRHPRGVHLSTWQAWLTQPAPTRQGGPPILRLQLATPQRPTAAAGGRDPRRRATQPIVAAERSGSAAAAMAAPLGGSRPVLPPPRRLHLRQAVPRSRSHAQARQQLPR